MTPFDTLTAPAVPLRLANVDTDQLLPGRFLRKPRSDGYDNYLFHDVRRDADGALRPDFPLNDPRWAGAPILVADRNFGGGSSREGAVYALVDAGIRAVIAPSFGDIFYSNAIKNGLLPIRLPVEAIERLWQIAEVDPSAPLTVDLAAQTVRPANGEPVGFEIDPFHKSCLLAGTDDIDLTLEHADAISAFERSDRAARPWRAPAG
ncbi:3-isopropylmalate dehydratase small subunit [Thalassobaculum fulvum]|uniref:3-isopropylmalate dehydratase small subunit n=1 Tax=Thalassobaculum fulvum TaxID=1633335 RepID=A0A919CQU7_9PROT|nr:3-isopropylmalate dehydratase small subunit [Thalassobaculum fulvum]GHD56870.1 3-isopropylmalate dehydratase small subunit [Thalassobaculum fulvum]